MPPRKRPQNKRKAADQGNDVGRDRQTRSQARAFNNLTLPSTSGINNTNDQANQRPANRPTNQRGRGRIRARGGRRGRGRGVSRGTSALNRGSSVSLPRPVSSASSTPQQQVQGQNDDVLDVDVQFDADDDLRRELDHNDESVVIQQPAEGVIQQQNNRRHDNGSHANSELSTSGTSSHNTVSAGNSAGPSAETASGRREQQVYQPRADQLVHGSAGENVLSSFGRVVSGGVNSLTNNPAVIQNLASSSNMNNYNIHNNNDAILFNRQDASISGINNTGNNNEGLYNNTSNGQVGNLGNFTMNSCPQPQALTSICSPLGECIPLNLKQKIIRGEFVDLGLLLDKGEAQAMSDQNESPILELNAVGQLVMREAKSQQKITSIHSWTSAFFVYTAIYLSAHPGRTQELLKYSQIIRTAAARFQGYGWRQYDIQFRLRKQIHPNTSWASMDGELWNLYIAVPSPSFPSNSRGGRGSFFSWLWKRSIRVRSTIHQ